MMFRTQVSVRLAQAGHRGNILTARIIPNYISLSQKALGVTNNTADRSRKIHENLQFPFSL